MRPVWSPVVSPRRGVEWVGRTAAESAALNAAVGGRHEDVFGLDIAMNDAIPMRPFEDAHELLDVPEALLHRQPTGRTLLPQVVERCRRASMTRSCAPSSAVRPSSARTAPEWSTGFAT